MLVVKDLLVKCLAAVNLFGLNFGQTGIFILVHKLINEWLAFAHQWLDVFLLRKLFNSILGSDWHIQRQVAPLHKDLVLLRHLSAKPSLLLVLCNLVLPRAKIRRYANSTTFSE